MCVCLLGLLAVVGNESVVVCDQKFVRVEGIDIALQNNE